MGSIVLVTCLVWERLVLPSDTQVALSLPSLRGSIGNTSGQQCEYVSISYLSTIDLFYLLYVVWSQVKTSPPLLSISAGAHQPEGEVVPALPEAALCQGGAVPEGRLPTLRHTPRHGQGRTGAAGGAMHGARQVHKQAVNRRREIA